LTLWDEILPPIPEVNWRENLAIIAAWLAEFGGEPLAKPPRIAWKAPSSLPVAEDLVAGLPSAGVADADRRQGEPEAEVGDRGPATAAADGSPGRVGPPRDEVPAAHPVTAADGQTADGQTADGQTADGQTADGRDADAAAADAKTGDAKTADATAAGSVPGRRRRPPVGRRRS